MLRCEVETCEEAFLNKYQLRKHWGVMHVSHIIRYFCPVNKCDFGATDKNEVVYHVSSKDHRSSWRDAETRDRELNNMRVLPQELVENDLYVDPGSTKPPQGFAPPKLERDAPDRSTKQFKTVDAYWRQKGYKTPFVRRGRERN